VSTQGALGALQPGEPVRIVEHDGATRQPKPGGEVIPATVYRVTDGGAYIQVSTERYGLLSFWRESGWHAWDGEFRWRLETVSS
jgi:hypothetical protein